MRTQRLANKTALITGGAAGIGAATARLFCQEGAAVMLVDSDQAALDKTRQALQQAFPNTWIAAVTADVADEDLAFSSVKQCLAERGGLDLLVSNAAMRNYAAAVDATPQQWQAIVNVNLVGMSNYCRAALPALRQSGAGSIVIVSSCYAVTGRRGMGLYDASKAAQLAYMRTLAFEEANHGVRANAVCPGSTLTEFHLERAKNIGKSQTQLSTERQHNSLLGRWATPEEIAWPIVWLSSDEASFITGTTLMVDAGLHIM